MFGFREKRLRALALSFFLLPACTLAQVDKGTLLGTVSDSSQAVIPQTVIRVTEVNTGVTRSVITNENGNWTIPLLDPGTYRVEGEHQGFKKGIREGIPLVANSNVRVDISLELGSVNESVDVVASDAPILQTDRADVSQKIEADLLQQLPLGNNR